MLLNFVFDSGKKITLIFTLVVVVEKYLMNNDEATHDS